jgi:Spy/CpxP family protein refolding chaperone
VKIRILMVIALAVPALWAQAPAPPALPPGIGPRMSVTYRQEMGKWWQNSDVVKKLQLTDGEISQLDQIFYEHRLKLIDYGAAMEKQDLKLQQLLDMDNPDDAQVNAQVDQVLAARGKLEREFTMMNLALRRVLFIEQWRQLKSMRGEAGAFGDRIFLRKVIPGTGMGVGEAAPLPPGVPAPPPPPPDDME